MRRPISGQTDGEMGRYVFVDDPEVQTPQEVFDFDRIQPGFSSSAIEASVPRPEVDVVVNVKQPGKLKKYLAVGAAGLALTGFGAKFISDNMPKLPQVLPEASHSLEAEISAPEVEVVENVSINVADVYSDFEYFQHTSLDRSGIFAPFNCDMTIDDTVSTYSNASVLIEEAEVAKTDEGANIEVTGDISLNSMTSVSGGIPYIKKASGSVDVCKGNNEERWAERVAFGRKQDKEKELDAEAGLIENAGNIALACAMVREGEDLLHQSIIHNARVFSEKLRNIDPEDITVIYNGDFESEMQSEFDSSVVKLHTEFGDVAHEYYEETDDHTEIKLNTRELIDCDAHEITVVRQG